MQRRTWFRRGVVPVQHIGTGEERLVMIDLDYISSPERAFPPFTPRPGDVWSSVMSLAALLNQEHFGNYRMAMYSPPRGNILTLAIKGRTVGVWSVRQSLNLDRIVAKLGL